MIPWEPSYPYRPDSPKKRTYIDYRIAGHEEPESLALAGVSQRTYYLWKHDRDFEYWNGVGMGRLRKENRSKLIGDKFILNANLIEQMDKVFLTKLQLKTVKGKDLTDSESKKLDKLRNIYAQPTQQKAIKEMVDSGKHKGTSLLDVFKALSGDIVDGEVRELDEVPSLQPTYIEAPSEPVEM